MIFAVSDLVSESQLGASSNDDCASFVDTASGLFAWVIDGATSVAERPYVDGGGGDPCWFSHALSDALRARAGRVASPRELHAMAVADVAAAYQSLLGGRLSEVPIYARPSAALTIARITDGRADVFYLGDCPAFGLSTEEVVARITDHQPPDGEADLRKRVERAQSERELTPKQMFREQLPWLQAQRQRQLLARPLDVSAAIGGASFGGWELSLDLRETRALVLMSDGYERFSAQYDLGSPDQMVRATVRDGASAVLERVRQAERSDPDCRKIPRLKTSDDATCLVLSRASM